MFLCVERSLENDGNPRFGDSSRNGRSNHLPARTALPSGRSNHLPDRTALPSERLLWLFCIIEVNRMLGFLAYTASKMTVRCVRCAEAEAKRTRGDNANKISAWPGVGHRYSTWKEFCADIDASV